MNKKYAITLSLLLGTSFLAFPVSAEDPMPQKEAIPTRQELGLRYNPNIMTLSKHAGVLTAIDPSDEDVTDRRYIRKKAAVKNVKGNKNEISEDSPLTLTADKMYYNGTSGDVKAKGKVEVKHVLDTYETEYVFGNTLTKKYVIPGEVVWTNPTTNVKASSATYDGANGKGTFEKISGWDHDTYYFQGNSGTYDKNANEMTVENGYFTTRHAVAKVPDYRIEADRIEVVPGDHYTAYNVKLMAKNTTLISMSKYTGSLKRNDGEIAIWTLLPQPSYDSDNGFGLRNSLSIPINENPDFSVYLKNRWYSKVGYKPELGVRYHSGAGTWRLYYAEKETSTNDEGGIWVKKRPTLEYTSERYYFCDSPIYISGTGQWGYWDEGKGANEVKGSYMGYDIKLSSELFAVGKFINFSWNLGFAKDYYGYDNSSRSNFYYSLALDSRYKSWASWIRFTDRDFRGDTPYLYDSYTSNKPLDFGIYKQLTKNDAVSLAWTIDVDNGDINHRYYTYYRDMHSFYAWIRYDSVEGETRFMVTPKDFKF